MIFTILFGFVLSEKNFFIFKTRIGEMRNEKDKNYGSGNGNYDDGRVRSAEYRADRGQYGGIERKEDRYYTDFGSPVT